MKCGVRGGVAADVQSLPVRGAWVEIGLIPKEEWLDVVAPRAGSVG